MEHIYSTHDAFAALKLDGSIVVWGDAGAGGDSTDVQKQIADLCRNHPFKLTYTDTGEPAPEKQPGWWTGHIHVEDDSHLKTNDGRIIVHAGYESAVKESEHGSSASP